MYCTHITYKNVEFGCVCISKEVKVFIYILFILYVDISILYRIRNNNKIKMIYKYFNSKKNMHQMQFF